LARYRLSRDGVDLGVALLPFIDEKRLIDSMKPLWEELTEEEQIRNIMGSDLLYVGPENTLFESLAETLYSGKNGIEVLHSQFHL
jgi:5'-3' exoribonuclease 2